MTFDFRRVFQLPPCSDEKIEMPPFYGFLIIEGVGMYRMLSFPVNVFIFHSMSSP